jgi:hypothetical protein
MLLGNLGHLLVIISFVTALVATFAYFRASNLTPLPPLLNERGESSRLPPH